MTHRIIDKADLEVIEDVINQSLDMVYLELRSQAQQAIATAEAAEARVSQLEQVVLRHLARPAVH